MAGNARFHDKLHRKNHHTLPTVGYPDSANDPIASASEPFQGDFVVNGRLSASSGISILSAHIEQDLDCENAYVRDTTYTNFISGYGTETIISDGALTGYGDKTLTMDYRKAVYVKTPVFNILGNVSATSALYVDENATIKNKLVADNIGVAMSSPNEKLTINGNVSFYGTSAHYIKSPYGSDNGLMVFGGSNTGANSYLVHLFYSLSTRTGGRIDADGSHDIILPYQQRNVVYGSENVTRYFLVSGTTASPSAVASDSVVGGIRAFAYSGGNKFNTYGGGGNASIDLKTSGEQSLTNGGGYIIFNTMPMNSGNTVGASERMRITSEGKVGIGTTTPTGSATPLSAEGRSLHVYNNTNDNTSTNSDTVVVAESVNRNAYFLASVGVDGGLSIKRSSDAKHLGRIIMNQTNDTIFQAGDGSYGLNETMRILSGGNVGIGTITPNQKLTVNGVISSNNYIYSQDIWLNRGNTDREGGQINFNRSYDNALAWAIDTYTDVIGSLSSRLRFIDTNSNTERVTILSSGNVGIGTHNPTERLHVIGNVLISGNLSALGDTTQIDTAIVTTSAMVIDMLGSANALRITQRGTGNALLVEDESSDSTAFVINSAGDVGIGHNTPSSKLHVVGSITIPYDNYLNFSENGNGHTSIKRNGADNGMEFFTNSNSRMFISDAGNVGIGTKTQLHSPNDKLEVAGNVGAYGYRAKQQKPSGNPLTDSSPNGYAFGDDGDTGMFSPLNTGDTENESVGKIGWYCNNIETARTFINSQPIFTIGGLSAASETYGRTTLVVGDGNNGGLMELRDGAGGHSIIYRDAFTNSLWLEGRTNNSNIVLSTIGTGSITMAVTGSSTGLFLGSNGNIGMGTNAPESKLHVNGGLTLDAWNPSAPASVESTNLSSVYIKFNSGGAATDWAYLRQIGNSDELSLALDLHDNENVTSGGQSFCIRNIKSTATPDIIYTNFIVTMSGGVGAPYSLSGTGNRAVYSDGNGILTNTASDSTLKKDVSIISQGLNEVLQLNPVSFNWKNTQKYGEQREIGFLAQEVQPIVPEVIGSNSDGTLSLDYSKMIAVLTKAIQELNTKVDAQALEIAKLKNNQSK